jgi:hypothetical protein
LEGSAHDLSEILAYPGICFKQLRKPPKEKLQAEQPDNSWALPLNMNVEHYGYTSTFCPLVVTCQQWHY